MHTTWQSALAAEFTQPYWQTLQGFLAREQAAGKTLLPPQAMRFNALQATALDKVKVVILGQDPYPTLGHAHGLSFSVLPDVKPLPRSLQNINKELLEDVGVDNRQTGCQCDSFLHVIVIQIVSVLHPSLPFCCVVSQLFLTGKVYRFLF